MKIILSILVCLFFSLNLFAQTENTEEILVEEVTLWRIGIDNKPKEEVENFLTSDKTLFFRIQLNSVKPATVKMVLVAVNVPGIKAETKSVTVSYTTNGKQNIVNFRAQPEDVWTAGTYRADIFINGKIAAKKEFLIEKPANTSTTENTPQTVPKLKTTRRARKN